MQMHYEPYSSEYEITSVCGLESENLETSNVWQDVTCKRCLRSKEKIKKYVELVEKDIVNQMGEMADFYKNNLKNE